MPVGSKVAILARTYQNSKTLETVKLVLSSGRPNDAYHYFSPPLASDRPIERLDLHFGRGQKMLSWSANLGPSNHNPLSKWFQKGLSVDTMTSDGDWKASGNPKWDIPKHDVAYRMYLISEFDPADDADEATAQFKAAGESIGRFVAEVMPQVNDALFGNPPNKAAASIDR